MSVNVMTRRFYFIYYFYVLRERERERARAGERQRGKERERIPVRLQTVSAEPDAGLELMNPSEIMT